MPIETQAPGRMRKRVLGVLFFTVVLATITTFFGAQHYFERLETNAASNRMALYLRALNETFRQHQHLPFVLARDPRYAQVLQSDAVDPVMNDRLKLLAEQAKLEAIYVMNADGRVVATSNADEPHSFLGQNYGFRPYFQDALQGARSDYFAIGATSGRPGYFVAEQMSFPDSGATGVVAIKLDVSEFQRSWESLGETIVAINKDGIIVLASDPDWLYRPVRSLAPEVKSRILQSRQFGQEALEPLVWANRSDNHAFVEGTAYLLASGASEWRDWTVHYLQPQSIILRQTLLTTAFFGSIVTFLLGFATFLRSRRIELAYTTSEQQRKALVETNQQLEQAQTELARSAKLAALGHLAASVTHELGQPISAFRNHLAAAEMGNEITSPRTASSLNKLVDRMEEITRQFKFFARSGTVSKSDVNLSIVLEEVENLIKAEIQAGKINLIRSPIAAPIIVKAHQIQLEQAFTNLLTNAIHAVETAENPQIQIDVVKQAKSVEIHVIDNGHGLAGARLTDLQEPFFTSKPSGVGMGLGLAITSEIIKDHGGTLTIGDTHIGAKFIVTLPINAGGDAE